MSRKIDALVAEKVMGKRYWKELRAKHYLAVAEHNGREPWTSRRLEHQEKERYAPITAMEAVSLGFWGDSDRNLPRYSTDIASAWEVVENMRERRPLVNLMNDGWHCRMKVDGLDEEVYIDGQAVAFTQPSVHANGCDTAQLAICLAALRAVGVSESEIEAARNQTKGTE